MMPGRPDMLRQTTIKQDAKTRKSEDGVEYDPISINNEL